MYSTKTKRLLMAAVVFIAFGGLYFFVEKYNKNHTPTYSNRTVHSFTLENFTNVPSDFNDELTEVFYSQQSDYADFYTMVEGTDSETITGTYVLGHTPDDGFVWLGRVEIMTPTHVTLEHFVAKPTKEEWQTAQKLAVEYQYPFPSPRVFLPESIMVVMEDGTKFQVGHFSHH